ncbi:hypothetical protein IWW36_001151 [Coemansia brasiliensis]|uniref:Uncharacterized protein n=1 Tax=Coemansia brasiliensis TaxID=2650707 RepID=A0A9W8M1U2_9FUNG|nr:hypothetical protein IWW36_001151 [Coemansia brasiliensis]
MNAAVPDYIFASGLQAQQARSKRLSSRPTSPPTSPRTHQPNTSQDLEIKAIIGQLQGAHRAWPQQMQFDMPRLVSVAHIDC